MVTPHLLSGELGSAEQERQYAGYYAAIAEREHGRIGPNVSSYALRPGVGTGTIEVTTLQGGLRVVRYDVCFAEDHTIGYEFSEERFELEVCLDGRLRIAEDTAGHGTLGSHSSSLTPPRATRGAVVHPGGERYRGVSLTGHRGSLSPYLGSVGEEAFGLALAQLGSSRADELYLGSGPQLRGLSGVLGELFDVRAETAGKTLLMESRVMAALALLTDAGGEQEDPAPLGALGYAEHEIAALRTVPLRLWRERHDLPALTEVARALPMSPKRLSTGFRELFGVTPFEYHRRRCLERAAALLVETDWTVERIGIEVGYSSASNFVFAFRTRLGSTPSEYRRAHA